LYMMPAGYADWHSWRIKLYSSTINNNGGFGRDKDSAGFFTFGVGGAEAVSITPIAIKKHGYSGLYKNFRLPVKALFFLVNVSHL